MAEKEFDHQPEVWTIDDLRRAIADIPGDTPLRFMVAEEPGGVTAASQIAYSAKLGEDWDSTTRALFPAFQVWLDFPPGKYFRQVPDED